MLATASSPSLFSANPFHTASSTFGMQTLTNQEKDVLLFMQRLKSSTAQQETERSVSDPVMSVDAYAPSRPLATAAHSLARRLVSCFAHHHHIIIIIANPFIPIINLIDHFI
ncbi:uncharacterized protein ACA1_173050 [Acanthamoeba castellanii str. Neff]|uniref:Uncharacterized protein n=1 Tax=Acanthamoeba castellanii (strain ATCC 30010 / Neff) TaxID=1257118 RepID=L8HJ15_ACACF|nr:uncharacterized protein ACA1_173050 [Acanthamoeba castellanii str. Neff]ELR24678.1 hypothetical protein ACA1_173050 [Acanthamoeba castellanii str. Neff]